MLCCFVISTYPKTNPLGVTQCSNNLGFCWSIYKLTDNILLYIAITDLLSCFQGSIRDYLQCDNNFFYHQEFRYNIRTFCIEWKNWRMTSDWVKLVSRMGQHWNWFYQCVVVLFQLEDWLPVNIILLWRILKSLSIMQGNNPSIS